MIQAFPARCNGPDIVRIEAVAHAAAHAGLFRLTVVRP